MADAPQVWLLRHGQTDWNLEGRLQGRTDIALNRTGIAGAQQAAGTLAQQRFVRILSSPLKRAMQTARIVAGAQGIPAHADPRLIERDFGALEGMRHSDILSRSGLPDNFAIAENLPAGAEPWSQVKARMQAAYRDIQAVDGPVLIVSHQAALTALAEVLGRRPPAFPNSVPTLLAALPARPGCDPAV